MPALSPFDHAFADGPVFLEPSGFLAAFKMTRSLAAARRLQAVWRSFHAAGQLGPDIRLGLDARLVNRNKREAVSIGRHTVSRAIMRLEPTGRLTVGERCYFGDGVLISAMNHIQIGDGTLFAHGVQVFDNNTHPIDAEERERHFAKILGLSKNTDYRIAHASVTIGRRCWLGMNAIVFRGVTIGDDTVVAGGSVVSTDLPSGVIASGNPAVPVRNLKEFVAA
ncbi:MAG TPA: acyltransferase [Geminicoccus sp.]|uniref:acyltransferase n=1 Tax=Geminicoccus sp. TaxID=2024832 RepID=UPI002B817BF0|nr:acyltransferase [Geminicoccus sp.]HWL70929.1 acyltransferase [Geminicoccus sp.]